MAFAPEGASLAKLWTRYQDLSATEKLVMRLKALIGSYTNKTAFVSAMVATHSRAADGRAWTVKSANEALAGLQKLELLDDSFTCPKSLLHPVAADAAGGPDAESLIAAVRSTFPDVSARAYSYHYILRADEDTARRLDAKGRGDLAGRIVSVQIRSYCRSQPGSQAKREPSWCSIIPGSGLRGRFLRCAARFFAGRTSPEACSTLLVQP
ncbi:MAG: hypothetical protein U0S49_12520 [Rhodospirillales bacterium]|nr:hypothetical protein [Rhodospirillales bacterium]